MPAHTVRYWLFKSEPNVFSLDDLRASPRKTTCWEGVRNYQARNLLRDDLGKGDLVLFYHSRVKPMAVVGIARVVRAGYPDPYQFDEQSKYFDPKSLPGDPRWYAVDVRFEEAFLTPVTLEAMKAEKRLSDMMVVQRGARLSIQPVTKAQFDHVAKLGRKR